MLVDLHMHSTFSDGRLTPTELVQQAIEQHLGVIALTDHDSWNGYAEAQAEAERQARLTGQRLRVLVGVELSTQHEGRAVHVLGYHVDRGCQALLDKMNEMRHRREHRLEEMLAKCKTQGMELTVEACDPRNRAVGRPHVAKAMVEKGYVKTVQEAFDKYLHRGGPCYVEQPKLSPSEAVHLIHKAGGLAVLAHPSEIEDSTVPELLVSNIPFDGIEIWHPSATEHNDFAKWQALALKYQLRLSGGSDFHGILDRFPAKLGIWQVEYDNVKEIIEYKR